MFIAALFLISPLKTIQILPTNTDNLWYGHITSTIKAIPMDEIIKIELNEKTSMKEHTMHQFFHTKKQKN